MKILLSLFLLSFSLCLSAAVHVQIIPPENTDQLGMLKIAANEAIDFTNPPKINGITWGQASTSSQTSIVNGRYTSYKSITLHFKVAKPGEYVIPAFKLGNQDVEERRFKVAESPYDQLYFMKVNVEDAEKALYPGQYFGIKVKIYLEDSYTYRGGFAAPEFTLEGIKLNTYPNRSRGMNEIETGTESSETIKGKKFRVITLTYRGFTLLSGKYNGAFTHSGQLIKKKQTPGMSRPIRLNRIAELKEFQVSPLPTAPANTLPTSLVGQWKFTVSSDKQEIEAGTPFTLTYKISGKGGAIERLSLPQFKLEKFRQIKSNKKITSDSVDNSEATYEFFLAPLGSDVELKKLSFSTFDPEAGKYVIHSPELPQLNFTGPKFIPKKVAPPVNQVHKNEFKSNVPSLDMNPQDLRRPLLLNIHPLWWLCTILLPMLYLLKLLLVAPVNMDKLRQKKLRQLCRMLKKANSEYAAVIFSEQLIPLIAEIKGLPKSITSSELISQLHDSKLKDFLLEYDSRRFAAGIRVPLNGSRLANLLKLLCFIPLFISAKDQSQELWEQHDYLAAEQVFAKKLEASPNKASLHYNRGLALQVLDQPYRAMACFHTALRLNPRHHEARLQLAAIMSELDYSQEKIESLNQVLTYLRPDELVKIAIILWCLAFLILVIKRRKHWLSPALLFLVSFVCIALAYQKFQGPWQRGQYLPASAKVTTHEFADRSDLGFDIDQYEIIKAHSINNNSIQIEVNKQKRWVKSSDLIHFW